MPPHMDIPTSPADLTPTWLQQVLRESGTLPGGSIAKVDWRII